jgi:hypothetical protein
MSENPWLASWKKTEKTTERVVAKSRTKELLIILRDSHSIKTVVKSKTQQMTLLREEAKTIGLKEHLGCSALKNKKIYIRQSIIRPSVTPQAWIFL